MREKTVCAAGIGSYTAMSAKLCGCLKNLIIAEMYIGSVLKMERQLCSLQ